MSSTINLKYDRFVRQASTELLHVYAVKAAAEEAHRRLRDESQWRRTEEKTSDIPVRNAVAETLLSERYDAYKGVANYEQGQQRAYAGAVAYRFRVPFDGYSSNPAEILSVQVPVSVDRWLVDGVRVAVAASSLEAPINDWSSVRSGDANIQGQMQMQFVNSTPVRVEKSETLVINIPTSLLAQKYIYVYLTLEDYDTVRADSEPSPPDPSDVFWIEGGAIISGALSTVTFSRAIVEDAPEKLPVMATSLYRFGSPAIQTVESFFEIATTPGLDLSGETIDQKFQTLDSMLRYWKASHKTVFSRNVSGTWEEEGEVLEWHQIPFILDCDVPVSSSLIKVELYQGFNNPKSIVASGVTFNIDGYPNYNTGLVGWGYLQTPPVFPARAILSLQTDPISINPNIPTYFVAYVPDENGNWEISQTSAYANLDSNPGCIHWEGPIAPIDIVDPVPLRLTARGSSGWLRMSALSAAGTTSLYSVFNLSANGVPANAQFDTTGVKILHEGFYKFQIPTATTSLGNNKRGYETGVLGNPTYEWRARYIVGANLIGDPAVSQFGQNFISPVEVLEWTTDGNALSPVSPIGGAAVDGNPLRIVFSGNPRVTEYEIEIREKPSNAVVYTITTNGPIVKNSAYHHVVEKPLPPGTYDWRVRWRQPNGGTPARVYRPWSVYSEFEIEPASSADIIDPAVLGAGFYMVTPERGVAAGMGNHTFRGHVHYEGRNIKNLSFEEAIPSYPGWMKIRLAAYIERNPPMRGGSNNTRFGIQSLTNWEKEELWDGTAKSISITAPDITPRSIPVEPILSVELDPAGYSSGFNFPVDVEVRGPFNLYVFVGPQEIRGSALNETLDSETFYGLFGWNPKIIKMEE